MADLPADGNEYPDHLPAGLTPEILLEGLPHVVWTALGDGKFEYLNATGLRIFGLSRDDLVSGAWDRLLLAGERDVALRKLRESWRKEHPFERRIRLKLATGEFRWFSIRGNPRRNAAGGVQGWIGTLTDVHEEMTARRARMRRNGDRRGAAHQNPGWEAIRPQVVEEALIGQARQAMLDSIPALLAILDRAGTIVYVNTVWRRNAMGNGMRSDECGLGLNYLDVCEAASGEEGEATREVARNLRAVLGGGADEFSQDYPCEVAGKVRWFRMLATPLPEVGGAVVMHFDITDRKLAEHALEEAKNFAEALIARWPGLFLLVDHTGGLRKWNAHFVTVAGRDPAAGASDFYSFFRQEDRASLKGSLVRAERDGTAEAEIEMVPASRGNRLYQLAFHRMDAAGEILILVAGIDVTDRDRARAERDLLFELSPDLLCIADGDGRFRQINQAWERVLGYSREELMDCSYLDFVHPEDVPVTLAEAERVIGGVPTPSFENRYRCRDGTYRWISWHTVILRDTGLSLSVARDVTEQKQISRALRESERRFEAFMSRNPAVAWMKNAGGRYVYANHTLEKIYKVSLAEIVGQTDASFFSPEVARSLQENDCKVLHSGKPLEGIEEIPDADGNIRFWHVWKFPFYDQNGEGFTGGLAFEVTDRARAEAALRRSEERYRSLVDGAQDAVFALSAQGIIVSLNPVFDRITGWTREEWIDRPFHPLLHPEDIPFSKDCFEKVMAGEVPPVFELRVMRKDGEAIPMEFTVTPQWFDKNVVGVLGIARDIRRRKKLEESLRSAQRLESIGRLAAGIAHDFNNLLTIQQGYLSLVAPAAAGQPDIEEPIRQVALAAERAASLTRQLLLFSRKQAMQRKPIDLAHVVSGMVGMLGRILGKDIEMDFPLDDEQALPLVFADTGMMEQVVMNLVVNARDAMPEGGRLSIRLFEGLFNPPHPEGSLSSRYLCLAVRDTGCGIAKENLDLLFEPFFTTKEVGKGVGLGLATVYGIIAQHQGWIEVESEVGGGSTFRVYLPTTAAPREETASPSLAQLPHGQGETILVVEDEDSVRALIKSILTTLGYTVLTAPSGREALGVWAERGNAIELLLTDLVMPGGLSGKMLAEHCKTVRPELRVLFSSGYSQETVGGNDGEIYFLQKPYGPVELARAVRQVLDAPANLVRPGRSGLTD